MGARLSNSLLNSLPCAVCLVIPRTLEAHLGEVKLAELRERRDVLRDRATKLVAAEPERLERRCERRKQTQRLGQRRPCARRSRLKDFAGMSGHTTHKKRTVQRAKPQVELGDIVAELADVARQREAGLVVVEVDLAPLRLHANELERQLACARDRHVYNEGMSSHTLARTAEVASAEVEFCCVLDGADVARQREALVAVEVDFAAVRLELADREG